MNLMCEPMIAVSNLRVFEVLNGEETYKIFDIKEGTIVHIFHIFRTNELSGIHCALGIARNRLFTYYYYWDNFNDVLKTL